MRAILLLLMVFAFTHAVNANPSITPFVSPDEFLAMQISPDGKTIAANSFDGEEYSIIFFDAATMDVIDVMKFRFPDIIGPMHWVSNRRIVAHVYRYFYDEDGEFTIGELFSAEVGDKRGQYIFGYRAGQGQFKSRKEASIAAKHRNMSRAWVQVIDLLNDDPQHILVSARPWRADYAADAHIYKINVETSNIYPVSILEVPYAFVFTDGHGNLKGAFALNDSDRTDVYFFEPNDERWQKSKQLVDLDDARYAYFDSQKNRLQFFARIDDKRKLYTFDMATQQLDVMFSDERVDVSRVHIAQFKDLPYATSIEPGARQYIPLHGNLNPLTGLFSAMVNGFKGQHVAIESVSDDRKKVVFSVQNPQDPGGFYLFDADTGKSRPLAKRNQAIDAKALSPVQTFTYERDGKAPIHGYLTLPKQTSDKPMPVVVMLHSQPYRGGWSSGYHDISQLYASQGYAVLRANFPGAFGYGAAFDDIGVKQWGEETADAIVKTLNYVASIAPVDATKSCIAGNGVGAYLALKTTRYRPKGFKCVIATSGQYNFERIKEDARGATATFYDARFAENFAQDDGQIETLNLSAHQQYLKTPTLFIHRDTSKVQPLKEVEGIAEAMKASGVEVQIHELEQESRFDERIKVQRDSFNTVFAFLDKYLQ